MKKDSQGETQIMQCVVAAIVIACKCKYGQELNQVSQIMLKSLIIEALYICVFRDSTASSSCRFTGPHWSIFVF